MGFFHFSLFFSFFFSFSLSFSLSRLALILLASINCSRSRRFPSVPIGSHRFPSVPVGSSRSRLHLYRTPFVELVQNRLLRKTQLAQRTLIIWHWFQIRKVPLTGEPIHAPIKLVSKMIALTALGHVRLSAVATHNSLTEYQIQFDLLLPLEGKWN